MLDLFLNGNAAWFGVPALVGTGVFALRLVLMFLGHTGLDMGHDGVLEAHTDVGDAHHGDSTDAFKVLSLQSIAAFAMGFGWGGLGVLRGTDWNPALAVPVAVASGVAMVYLLAILLKAVYDMQSSGNIRIDDAVGTDGTVYVGVPEAGQGSGQVQVVVNGRQRIYNAVTDGSALASNTRVRVVAANDDNSLTVQAV